MDKKTDKIYLGIILFLFLLLTGIIYLIVKINESGFQETQSGNIVKQFDTGNNQPIIIRKQSIICFKDNEQIPQKGIDNLNMLGIWGTSANNVFAVGEDGVILHFDGIEWQKQVSPVTSTIFCVRGANENKVFACGSNGVIIGYDGKKWSKMETGSDKFINSLWFASENKGFAVGADGIILQYNGKEWKQAIDPKKVDGASFSDVWGFSEDCVYAVGNMGNFYHFNGKVWKKIPSYTNNWLLCIWGLDRKNFYVGAENSLIFRNDGDTFMEMNAGTRNSVFGMWGTSNENIYGVTTTRDGGSIIHYDGRAWKEIIVTEGYLSKIWGVDENLYFIVGEGKNQRYSWKPSSLADSRKHYPPEASGKENSHNSQHPCYLQDESSGKISKAFPQHEKYREWR